MLHCLRYFWMLACCITAPAAAALHLPALISDNMVLQQQTQGHLWGWAEPGEQVSASLAGRTAETVADAAGRWSLYLPRVPAGVYVLHLQGIAPNGTTSSRTLRNVAVGEVWVAAGQSNMEWPLSQAADAEQTLAQADHSEIRVFNVHKQTALSPQDDVSGYWDVLTPQTAGAISGVAYHFARHLQEKLSVPVGIIQASWGSTQVAAWTGMDALQGQPALKPLLDEVQQQLYLSDAEKQRRNAALRQWEAENYLPDPGIQGLEQDFSQADFNAADWDTVILPQTFNKMGVDGDGAIWFRREVVVPESRAGQDATLELGTLDDFDVAYVNGVKVGETNAVQPHHWLYERRYPVPAGLLQSGTNHIAVRVFDQYGDGGFTGRAAAMALVQGQQRLSLAGEWKYRTAYQAEAMQADFATIPPALYGLNNRNTPAVLYNAMIAPLTPYRIQGVIWYQGESDTPDISRFRVISPLMIQQWRSAWQQDFPFLLVQLANFEFDSADAPRQKWAEIREVQTWVNDTVANTGMVSAIDVGEADNVHPKDKLTVGIRLANLALSRVYGETGPYQGPVYHTYQREDDTGGARVRLQFRHAEGLKATGEIVAFELAGEDGHFYPAAAKLADNHIMLQSAAVPEPVRVRYAWRDNPVANVYNAIGLPLLPFSVKVAE